MFLATPKSPQKFSNLFSSVNKLNLDAASTSASNQLAQILSTSKLKMPKPYVSKTVPTKDVGPRKKSIKNHVIKSLNVQQSDKFSVDRLTNQLRELSAGLEPKGVVPDDDGIQMIAEKVGDDANISGIALIVPDDEEETIKVHNCDKGD